MNSKISTGLTNSEVNEKTRLSAELTTMTTTIIPISSSSEKCKDRILLQTILVPPINHRSRTEVISENGRLYPKYGNRSSYILISQDAVLSKSTKMFRYNINMIRRTCEIDSSVNATSFPSEDALFEDFHFQFKGNMTVTETCPTNGTSSSFEWTISANTKLRLPVVCSLHSKLINCNYIVLRSSKSKEVHFTHYRMEPIQKTGGC